MPVRKKRSLPGKHEKRLSRSSQLGLAIDGYDDIFSDFDPRPYKEKQLSQDFLTELRRFFFDKNPESVDLVLLLPANLRSSTAEAIIKRRLHIYFHEKMHELEKQLQHAKMRNILKVALSLLLMVSTGYLAVHAAQVLWKNILKVMLEPASWFLFWTSLEQLLFSLRPAAKELHYFRRLSECKIVFLPI